MELRFASEANHKNIQRLYPIYQFSLDFNITNASKTQNFVFHLEKLENIVQLRICDINIQSRMFVSTLDNMVYNEIRTEQSLQVDFQGFIDHLITILDSCRNGELKISLSQKQDSFSLDFYEKRSLRNLVHLSLRMHEASPSFVVYHLNLALANVRNEMTEIANQNQSLRNEVNKRDFHVQELSTEVTNLKAEIARNENMILHRNTEEIKKLNQELKNAKTDAEYEENRLKTLVKTYEAKVDQLTLENFTTNEKLKQEAKKYEMLAHDLDDARKKIIEMTKESDRLKKTIHQFDSKDKEQRMTLDEKTQRFAEISDKLRVADKEKCMLQAELDAEKQVCSTKKRALQIATFELSKNQETIKSKEKIIEKLEKGINWRALVMLRMNDQNEIKISNAENLSKNKQIL